MDKKTFMEAVYGAVGTQVSGWCRDTAFLGEIIDTRVKYGEGDVQVTVKNEHGDEYYFIDASSILEGGDSTFSNLHIYL
jgi:hypothetical protein